MKMLHSIGTLLLRFKESLPKNGDWLFVTESKPTDAHIDVSEPYKSPEVILAKLSGNAEPEAVELIYERAKAYENFVEGTANRVYDKSKVIFGAASFASTVLLALGSTLLPPLLKSAWWFIALGVILSVLIVVHLSRALMIAAKVMIREVTIRESPEELLELGAKKGSEVLRELAARILSYSIQTHAIGHERVNRLMIAQHSFRYALGFFIAMAVISSLAHLGGGSERSKIVGGFKDLGDLEKRISAIASDHRTLEAAVSRLDREHVFIQRDLRESVDLKKAQLDVFRALEAQLKSGQVNQQPPSISAIGKKP